ncbi:copper amine oxidase N-terminal domain-containing protein [Clostridium formicaceticum]|uniref:copper amine oxidase N-terminal domain-containing protein n=1 Tax=Clostridium formicaceticum TaxID=1497 RepID=UPI00196A8074|nr:copper amine oxidase N-terminal domain-containing protein [Clostridium formicaceticum]
MPRLADDYNSEGKTKGTFTPATYLVIERDNFDTSSNISFQLRIDGAKWSGSAAYGGDNKNEGGSVTSSVYNYSGFVGTGKALNIPEGDLAQFEVVSRTDRVLDITLIDAIDDSTSFAIPLFFEVNGSGTVQVTVDADTGVTSGTFTVANATKGATVTTVDDIVTFAEEGTLETIRIEETSAAALSKKDHVIKLRLPNNFEWVNSDVKNNVQFIGGLDAEVVSVNSYVGERDLDITIKVKSASSTRGAILISDLKVLAGTNAREGDVELRVSGGDVTTETITVAKYSDFDVIVKADGEPEELISGRFEGYNGKDADELDHAAFDDEAHELQTLIIEEATNGALLGNRRTRIEFPSWVKILGVDVDADDADVTLHGIDENEMEGPIFGYKDRGESYLELTINPDSGATVEAKVELTFYVSIKADAEGDIVAEVSGRSGAEGEVVLGTARRAVEMEIEGKTTIVDIGKKAQAIPDIIISEIEGEDLMEGDLVLNLSNGAVWNDYKVEVIEGDLEIDDVDDKDSNLIITIKKSGVSTKASTIKISNASIDVDRTIPDGAVNVRVRGTSARKNHLPGSESKSTELDAGYFDQNNVVSAKVADVLAGGESAVGRDAVTLTIGEIPAGGDAAPYISNNRTYAPVSAVAQSLGIAKNNIIWNEANRTVTIMGNKTVQMTIGSTTLLVNGTPVVMDVAPEITSSRTFLPIAWLAKALDVEYSWDAATQTVTFY